MDVIVVLIPVALVLGGAFAVLFVLSVRDGQFDDLDDPPLRALQDDPRVVGPGAGPRAREGGAEDRGARGAAGTRG